MSDEKIKKIFEKHDVDRSGTISFQELTAALRDLECDCSVGEVESLMKDIDVDHSGELNLWEFSQLFGDARLSKVFYELDRDGSGQISTEELQGALAKLGHNLTPREIKSIVSSVDTDKSGEVDYAEFKRFFALVPSVSLASMARHWMNATTIDCGSDLAPPITSPDAPWYYGLFGGIGGVLSRTLTAPLEKVKITAQTSSSSVSVMGELTRTMRTSGVRGLFAGNTANCLRVFPMASIVTYTYLNGLRFTPADAELDAMEPVYRGGAAAFAGCVGQSLTYPIDVVRAHMTVSERRGQSVLASAREIVKESGVRGLYRGLLPTLYAVAPFIACQMATADMGKAFAAQNGVEVTTQVMLLVASSAGVAAQTVVYPLDVLRRRMQLSGVHSGGASEQVLADRTWLALQQVVQREGFRSLFSGIIPTYAKVIPSVAVAMTTTKTLIGWSKEWKL